MAMQSTLCTPGVRGLGRVAGGVAQAHALRFDKALDTSWCAVGIPFCLEYAMDQPLPTFLAGTQ